MNKKELQHIEDVIDDTLDDSFPASDSPSFSPGFRDPIVRGADNIAQVADAHAAKWWIWWAAGTVVVGIVVGLYVSKAPRHRSWL